MSKETEVSAELADTDPTLVGIGERVRGILRAAELLPDLDEHRCATAADIGRMVRAFVQIDNPQIRSEFVALIEALRTFTSR